MFDDIFDESRFEEAVHALASIKMQECDEDIKKKSAEFMMECMRLEEQMMPDFMTTVSEILKNA